jgi:hypothetical protein
MASFNVYPNPSQGEFTVEIENTQATDLTITLTDVRGSVIYTNTVSKVINHQETIDRNLPKGIYLLSVNTGKDVKVQRVVIQ